MTCTVFVRTSTASVMRPWMSESPLKEVWPPFAAVATFGSAVGRPSSPTRRMVRRVFAAALVPPVAAAPVPAAPAALVSNILLRNSRALVASARSSRKTLSMTGADGWSSWVSRSTSRRTLGAVSVMISAPAFSSAVKAARLIGGTYCWSAPAISCGSR